MSTRYSVNEFEEIAKGLKDLEAAKLERINGVLIEDAEPVKAPEDIDFTGMYGYPAGYTLKPGALRPKYFGLNTISGPLVLKSLGVK